MLVILDRVSLHYAQTRRRELRIACIFSELPRVYVGDLGESLRITVGLNI